MDPDIVAGSDDRCSMIRGPHCDSGVNAGRDDGKTDRDHVGEESMGQRVNHV